MNNNELENEITSPITQATFTIVRNEIPKNIAKLSKWADNIVERANEGKFINISVDCEGFFLGCTKNSLLCIQVAEIFNDSFNIRTDQKPPPIGNKPGFLILSPFSQEVVQILSSVLDNQQVILYTFDFIGDFSSILNEGIKINMSNIFDSQVSLQNTTDYFHDMKVKPLTFFVENAQNLDPLCKNMVETDKDITKNLSFVKHYLFKDKKNPIKYIFNKKVLIKCSVDTYLTGLAALYCIRNGYQEKVLKGSLSKSNQFQKLVRKYNSPLGPSITRQLFFIDIYGHKIIQKSAKLGNSSENDLIQLLKLFKNFYTIIASCNTLNKDKICHISLEDAKVAYLAVIQKLEQKKDVLYQMMVKYE